MQIELQKSERNFNRGARYIVVDGVVWGHVVPYSHGPNGVEYRFRQEGCGELIMDGDKRLVRVLSDKLYHRRRQPSEQAEPLPVRLLSRIRDLINRGELSHPDELKRIQDKQERIRRAQWEAAAKRESEAFEQRAKEAIEAAAGNPDHLIVEIIEAMRWAQTK